MMTLFVLGLRDINLKKKQFVWLRISGQILNLDISYPLHWIESQVQSSPQGSLHFFNK